MAILTHSGRAALAASVKNEVLHLALGRGQPWWDSTAQITAAFDAQGRIALPHAPIAQIAVKSANGQTTYAAGQDYAADAQQGLITRLDTGQIAPGASVRLEIAYGRPTENVAATALLDEVCRRTVDEVYFVEPDPNGEIALATGRYRVSQAPTQHLFLRTKFDFGDAAGSTIREQAVFVGTQVQAGLPPGQRLFTPAEIASPGTLLLLEHAPPILRQASTRETFEFVLTF